MEWEKFLSPMSTLFSGVVQGYLTSDALTVSVTSLEGPAPTSGWRVFMEITAIPVQLNLRSAFGTSHSSTTTRTNAHVFLTVRVARVEGEDGEEETHTGVAEIGMPPLKPHVYEAEISGLAGILYYFCTVAIT